MTRCWQLANFSGGEGVNFSLEMFDGGVSVRSHLLERLVTMLMLKSALRVKFGPTTMANVKKLSFKWYYSPKHSAKIA